MSIDLDKIIQKAHTGLFKHSDSGDISALTVCMLFVVILNLVAIGAVTIRFGFHNKYIIFILSMVLLFLNYRIRMGQATSINQKFASYKNIDPGDKMNYANGITSYLESGIGIKITRISVVSLFFIILVPLFMISTYEFCYGFMSTKQLVISLLVIYPINYLIWKLYFSQEKADFYQLQREYANLNKELTAISQ